MAVGTSSLTRQYGTDAGAGVTAGAAERMVTGTPSPNNGAEPMPAASHVVIGDWPWASEAASIAPANAAPAASVVLNFIGCLLAVSIDVQRRHTPSLSG